MGFKPTSGGGIDQLTGEVTAGPGTGSQAATIAPVITAGSIGGATAVPEITYNAAGQITGVSTAAPDDVSKVPLSGGTMTGQLVVPDLSVSGLTGATAASRYVGATTSGAPTTGTFAVGDFVIDQTGKVWVCTTAGTPGTWTGVGGGALSYVESFLSGAFISVPASTPTNIVSVSLSAGTWVIHAQGNMENNSTTTHSVVDAWIGPTSASSTSAYAAMTTFIGADVTASGPYQEVSIHKVVVLSATTTVYFSVNMSQAGEVGFETSQVTPAVTTMSGISALKIA